VLDSFLIFKKHDPEGPIPQGAGKSDNSGNWKIKVVIQ
jgi:hypothetical protein